MNNDYIPAVAYGS